MLLPRQGTGRLRQEKAQDGEKGQQQAYPLPLGRRIEVEGARLMESEGSWFQRVWDVEDAEKETSSALKSPDLCLAHFRIASLAGSVV